MRVKVHPHRTKYLAGEEQCVSVTRDTEEGQRTTYYGAVWMMDVTLRVQPAGVLRAQRENRRNVHAWAVGEAMHLFGTQYHHHPFTFATQGDWEKVTYHYDSGEFRILSTGENVTGLTFPYAHIVGRDFYILDNRAKV